VLDIVRCLCTAGEKAWREEEPDNITPAYI